MAHEQYNSTYRAHLFYTHGFCWILYCFWLDCVKEDSCTKDHDSYLSAFLWQVMFLKWKSDLKCDITICNNFSIIASRLTYMVLLMKTTTIVREDVCSLIWEVESSLRLDKRYIVWKHKTSWFYLCNYFKDPRITVRKVTYFVTGMQNTQIKRIINIVKKQGKPYIFFMFVPPYICFKTLRSQYISRWAFKSIKTFSKTGG